MSEIDQNTKFSILGQTAAILFWILYIDYVFSMWDWIDNVIVFNLLDKIYYSFLLSSIVLLGYTFPQLYKILQLIDLISSNDVNREYIYMVETKRIRNIYNLTFSLIIFVLSRITEFFIFSPQITYLYFGILFSSYYVGIFIILRSPRTLKQILETIAIWILSFTGGTIYFIFYPIVWISHIPIQDLILLVFYCFYPIFGLLFIGNYIGGKDVLKIWKNKIKKGEKVYWKTYKKQIIVIIVIMISVLIIIIVQFGMLVI